MRLISFSVENFRAYQRRTTLSLDKLTTIIGRNDVGKSCLLEAMEIFFNNEAVKIDASDANVFSGSGIVKLTAEFGDLPDTISIDAGAETSLAAEYLLNARGNLEIIRTYDCSKKACPSETYVAALHPTTPGFDNLLDLKERELQALVKERSLEVALKGNPGMRQALWNDADDLKLAAVELAVSKQKEDAKRIWELIEAHLPIYALFQSDRQSRDSDGEVQNPMKGAVATAIAEAQAEIDKIQELVRKKSEEIAELTHKALLEIDPRLARSLTPRFTPPTPSKWTALFSLGMETDDSIPLNKRGSGVRRLILVSFFKAEAERKLKNSSRGNIIYAIEEPETSQHPANQRILIEAFKDLAHAPNCQVILTTHSPGLAADLPTESVRFISSSGPPDTPSIDSGADVFGAVADTLGLVPDSRVRILVHVEGPTDVEALRGLSSALHARDPNILNLATDERCVFIVLGGSTLKHWVAENYLAKLRRPEVHIYDGDVAKYAESVAEVNGRTDGLGSWAAQTAKHEIESYLHADAIFDAYGVTIDVCDHPEPGRPAVPEAFGEAYAANRGFGNPLNDKTSKKYLSKAFVHMTAERIDERDPAGEIRQWLERISALL
jgi:predicted ATPase